jgi:Family of unknown function (DUF6452)
VLLHRYILTVIQRITKNISPLLAVVWACSIVGCRDFEDSRTPHKSFVRVMLKPINEGGELTVKKVAPGPDNSVLLQLQDFANDFSFQLPLDLNADSVQCDIHTSSPTSPAKLTIHYHRQPVLISHQCGCAYQYVVKDVTVTSGAKLKIINERLSTFNDSDIDIQISL